MFHYRTSAGMRNRREDAIKRRQAEQREALAK